MKLIRNIETGEVFHAESVHAKNLVNEEGFEFIGLDDAAGEDVASAPVVESEEETPNLDSPKKAELIELAEKHGIDHDAKATKDDLIELLEEGQDD